uniref:Uncharacterized protein n=1 Tax=Rhizophora mucronata TaxID=61149 RepID=A0A2P2QE55_RHIMU
MLSVFQLVRREFCLKF